MLVISGNKKNLNKIKNAKLSSLLLQNIFSSIVYTRVNIEKRIFLDVVPASTAWCMGRRQTTDYKGIAVALSVLENRMLAILGSYCRFETSYEISCETLGTSSMQQ